MRSLDAGMRWTQVASLGPLFSIGPSLEAGLQTGAGRKMWLSYIDRSSCAMHGCSVGGFQSVDGGLTWQADGIPDPSPGTGCGDFAPPDSVAIAPTGVVLGTYWRSLGTCEAPAASLSRAVGGAWQPVHSWNFFSPQELTFPSASVGYAENGAAVLATRDGGATWSQMWPAVSPTDGLDALSASTAFGYGSQGSSSSILVTTDSGRAWKIESHLPGRVLALDMDNRQAGFAAAAGTGPEA